MKSVDLSIIVPIYNESHRLAAGLEGLFAYLSQSKLTTEVLLVDDGSTDGTAAMAEQAAARHEQVRLIRLTRNRGKGAAVKAGMLAATGRVRLFTDIDLSVPIATADEFYRLCRDGNDIVIGTRKITTSNVEVHQPRYRELLGEVFRQTTLRLFTPGLTDITCGFKAFTAEATARIFAQSVIQRWSFDAEILFLALRYGMAVKEIPVTWRNNPETKVRLAVDLPRSLMELIRVRWRWATGGYAKA